MRKPESRFLSGVMGIRESDFIVLHLFVENLVPGAGHEPARSQ